MYHYKKVLSSLDQTPFLSYFFKYLLLCLVLGSLVGSITAFFLWSLDWATTYREANVWIIALLPLAGFVIGWTYYKYGKQVVKGNNIAIEEYYTPNKTIPFRMLPMILFSTIATHLFGGSAGREGTAVQMGTAISDRFSHALGLSKRDRQILLIAGISAGFGAVFGTPLAAGIFGLEVLVSKRLKLDAMLPSFMAAFFADYFCTVWGISHTSYTIGQVASFTPVNILWAILAGVIFGLAAMLFSKSTHFWTNLFASKVKYPPFRPVIGGIVLALGVYVLGTTKYIGLGIPTIVDAFSLDLNSYDFLLKILFTSFTLGAGFKGGEVTPLFFIGASLGNVLVWFIPLPIGLLAGMGFVAVFAGATNTPIACTVMGIELFGIESGVFLALACGVAYLCSGHSGIYASQPRELWRDWYKKS